MSNDDPANQTDKSGLSPNQRAMINEGIVIGGNLAGVALTFAGIPGTGPVLAGLGGLLLQSFAPGPTPEQAYYDALSQQIAQMEQVLLTDLQAISKQVLDLNTDLNLIYDQLSLQINLTNYNTSRAYIDQYYADFVDYIDQIAQKNYLKDNIAGLFQLLHQNSDTVAIQMEILYETLMNQTDGTPGLISQQATFVTDRVKEWIENPSNYSGGTYTNGPINFQVYDCRNIIYSAYQTAAADALQKFVFPFVQAVMTLQYRGLTFLTTAWAGSAHTEQIKKHVDHATAISRLLQTLFRTITDPATIDATVKDGIVKVGFQRASGDGTGGFTSPSSSVNVDGWVFWSSWGQTVTDRWGQQVKGLGYKCVDMPDDLTFDHSYNSCSVLRTDGNSPWHGNMHAEQQLTHIPYPSSVTPNPLTPELGATTAVLTQTIAQAGGPCISMKDVPPAAGGTVWGYIQNQPDPTAAQAQVFEYAGGSWTERASNVAIGADGGFLVTVEGGGAAMWIVLVTQPGWEYAGNKTAPFVGANVIAYTTVLPS